MIFFQDPHEQVVRIVMSTWRLLQMMRKSDNGADATYKVLWQGFPIMVFRTSDHNQVFHPYGLAVCNAESTKYFRFIFQNLHNYNLEWRPSIILLGDGCGRITKGYVQVFSEPHVRVMCFYHVLTNVKEYTKVLPRELGQRVKGDIKVLQTGTNEESCLSVGRKK